MTEETRSAIVTEETRSAIGIRNGRKTRIKIGTKSATKTKMIRRRTKKGSVIETKIKIVIEKGIVIRKENEIVTEIETGTRARIGLGTAKRNLGLLLLPQTATPSATVLPPWSRRNHWIFLLQSMTRLEIWRWRIRTFSRWAH